jgi:galactokinase
MPRTFWAPGRVNLIGEFTDLAGGLALPAALDLGISLEIEPADRIELEAGDFGLARLAADGAGEAQGWARYAAAVAAELAALGRPPVGIRGTVTSTLPVGAGLSSSAALEVVLGLALCAVADFPLEPMELALAAQRAEHRAVGVPCGIMDQAASVLGVRDTALLLDTATLEAELVPLPSELAIVIVDSGVSRSLEHSGYATRKRELDAGMPSRVRHIHTESPRVLAAAEALRSRDFARLGEIFREGHESLRVDFEVTIPELDRLVDRAYELGALAARMTGGGFGGAIVALVETGRAAAFVDEIGDRAWICRASDGAREL